MEYCLHSLRIFHCHVWLPDNIIVLGKLGEIDQHVDRETTVNQREKTVKGHSWPWTTIFRRERRTPQKWPKNHVCRITSMDSSPLAIWWSDLVFAWVFPGAPGTGHVGAWWGTNHRPKVVGKSSQEGRTCCSNEYCGCWWQWWWSTKHGKIKDNPGDIFPLFIRVQLWFMETCPDHRRDLAVKYEFVKLGHHIQWLCNWTDLVTPDLVIQYPMFNSHYYVIIMMQ